MEATPTLEFRWYEEREAYHIETYYYEVTGHVPVRALQQLWMIHHDDGTIEPEWRDVPIHKAPR